MKEELPGKLTISRVRSNMDNGYIAIRIEDESSGCVAAEIKCSPVQFAEVLMGLACQECSFSVNTSGVLGKVRELKEIVVPEPPFKHYQQDADARKAAIKWIAKHFKMTDGWEPNHPSEIFNSHRRTKDGMRVSLVRFVEPEATP